MNKKLKDLKLKNKSIIQGDKPSNETVQNSTQDLNFIFNNLKKSQKEIENCKSIENLNEIVDLKNISNDLGLIIQNYVIIDDLGFKQNIEELNQLYRDVEILYFNKKIELLNNQIKDYDLIIKDTFKKSEDNLKDITGGTLFSIASVFLGISLTSALVSGVQYIGKEFIFLYFITCLLIMITTIGVAAIFMRKADTKSYIITFIVVLISIAWIITAFLSYQTYNKKDNNNIVEIGEYNKINKNKDIKE